MPERADKRRRTDLDLFVLALINDGVSTPYELEKAAGVSQGASLPALQRLVKQEFIRPGKPGARGRTDYKATAAGRTILKSGWISLVEGGPSGDLEADLRIALLALRAGDRQAATRFLHQSADKRFQSLSLTARKSDDPEVAPLARWYTGLRLLAAKTLGDAESTTIRIIAESLPLAPSDTGGRSKRRTSRKTDGGDVVHSVWHNIEGDTKTETSRKPVPLPGVVLDLLNSWRKTTLYNSDHDYLFPSVAKNGAQPISPDMILKRHIRPALKELGVTKRIGWHSFRHGLATLLRQLGVDLKTAQEILRHANPRLTQNVYQQVVSQEKRDAQALAIYALFGQNPSAPFSTLGGT